MNKVHRDVSIHRQIEKDRNESIYVQCNCYQIPTIPFIGVDGNISVSISEKKQVYMTALPHGEKNFDDV